MFFNKPSHFKALRHLDNYIKTNTQLSETDIIFYSRFRCRLDTIAYSIKQLKLFSHDYEQIARLNRLQNNLDRWLNKQVQILKNQYYPINYPELELLTIIEIAQETQAILENTNKSPKTIYYMKSLLQATAGCTLAFSCIVFFPLLLSIAPMLPLVVTLIVLSAILIAGIWLLIKSNHNYNFASGEISNDLAILKNTNVLNEFVNQINQSNFNDDPPVEYISVATP